jgi:hypothetical protein
VIPGTLGVLLTDAASGRPLERVPVFAELAAQSVVPLDLGSPRIPEQVQRATYDAVRAHAADVAPNQAGADRVARSLAIVVTTVLAANSTLDQGTVIDLAIEALPRAIADTKGGLLASLDDSELARTLWAALAGVAREHEIDVPHPPEQEQRNWSYPLGMLATDHAGYCSFDLLQLPQLERSLLTDALASARAAASGPPSVAPTTPGTGASLYIYPLSLVGTIIDALANPRIAADAVLAKVELAAPAATAELLSTLGLASMQRPAVPDWRLSPSSFTASPEALLATEGCEDFMPSNLAVREFFAYQSVALTDLRPDDLQDHAEISLGLVQSYRLAWYALGHSLGEVLHSTALAPGESVNLAVIDWTRSEATTRTEDTTVSESLLSEQNRDRQITETLSAALDEYQHGSNFQGGIAGSAGGSAGTGAYGGAAGISGALGGSTASTSGARNLTAQTTQSLADHISQASSALRELRSTVVVQTNEAEHENIQTRTITNYNHSHALTVLYYEVLRHFRFVTEPAQRQPVVFWRPPNDWLADADVVQTIVERRSTLQAALLDQRVLPGFDAAAHKVEHQAARNHAPGAVAPGGPIMLRYFAIEVTAVMGKGRDGQHFAPLTGTLMTAPNQPRLKLVTAAGGDVINNQWGSYRGAQVPNLSVAKIENEATVSWRDLSAVTLNFTTDQDQTEYDLQHIKIWASDLDGNSHQLVDEAISVGYINQGDEIIVPVPKQPPDPPPAPDPNADSPVDETAIDLLVDHLRYHRAYYTRALWIDEDPADRLAALTAVALPDGTLAQKVENRVLDVVGDQLVLPVVDSTWQDLIDPEERREPVVAPIEERLLSYTTRGIFGEARLGHCNSSELIDNTRFWDWQTSPIPNKAPEIGTATPVTPQPTQQAGTTPTAFPSPIVNIQAAPSEPDPTGLSAALSAIVTPNIFRDLSGQAETAQLLQALAADSVSIAQASEAARNIQAKYGSGAAASSGAGGGSALPPGTPGVSPRATPTQPSRANRDLQDTSNVLQRAVEAGSMTPQQAQTAMNQAAENAFGTPAIEQARFLVPDAAAPAAPPGFSFAPWSRLLNFRAPTAVATKALAAEENDEARYTHFIERAFSGNFLVNESPLNLDYYPVLINKMPTLPGTAAPATSAELLEYIRLHINDFLDTSNTEFSPLEHVKGGGVTTQGALWTSAAPLGAVLHLDIHAGGQIIGVGSSVLPDDNACVYVGEAAADHWIFCTMYRSVELGDVSGGEFGHPVSGNRMFGVMQANNQVVFFTRGADRPTSYLDAAKWETVFAGADALWKSLQQLTVNKIASMGGAAVIGTSEQHTIRWSSVPPGVFDPIAAGFPPQYWRPDVIVADADASSNTVTV